jgi:hypothetical protein
MATVTVIFPLYILRGHAHKWRQVRRILPQPPLLTGLKTLYSRMHAKTYRSYAEIEATLLKERPLFETACKALCFVNNLTFVFTKPLTLEMTILADTLTLRLKKSAGSG